MIGFCERWGEQQALDACIRDLENTHRRQYTCKNHTHMPRMNVDSASIDAKNATTDSPRGISRFSDGGDAVRSTPGGISRIKKKKKNHRKTSPRCPNRNEHGMPI